MVYGVWCAFELCCRFCVFSFQLNFRNSHNSNRKNEKKNLIGFFVVHMVNSSKWCKNCFIEEANKKQQAREEEEGKKTSSNSSTSVGYGGFFVSNLSCVCVFFFVSLSFFSILCLVAFLPCNMLLFIELSLCMSLSVTIRTHTHTETAWHFVSRMPCSLFLFLHFGVWTRPKSQVRSTHTTHGRRFVLATKSHINVALRVTTNRKSSILSYWCVCGRLLLCVLCVRPRIVSCVFVCGERFVVYVFRFLLYISRIHLRQSDIFFFFHLKYIYLFTLQLVLLTVDSTTSQTKTFRFESKANEKKKVSEK